MTWSWFEPSFKLAAALKAAAEASPTSAADALRSLIETDTANVLDMLKANHHVWANRLRSFLAEQCARHGCTDGDIMAVAIDLLRRLTVSDGAEFAARLKAECSHVKRWEMFFAVVASEMEQKAGKQGAG